MLYSDISKIIGYYLCALAAIMACPLFVAIYFEYAVDTKLYPHPHTTLVFIESCLVCLAAALLFLWLGRDARGHIYRREGLALVVALWLVTPAIAALPFYLSGTLTNYCQAYFEMASGLTTTGNTVLQAKAYDPDSGAEVPIVRTVAGALPTTYVYWGNIAPVRDPDTGKILYEGIEAISRALLFWRSMVQWFGGVGVVVLFVAILPALGVGGKLLFRSEITGPIKDVFTPRVKETAMQLCKIYLAMTVAETALLLLVDSKLALFDAITITFSTLSTAGYSVKNGSIGAYHSLPVEIVVIFFMVAGATNFSLYYHIFKGKIYRLYETEFILFLALTALLSGGVVYFLTGTPNVGSVGNPACVQCYSTGEAARYGIFQLISAMTTTGFSTANYDLWPYPVQVIMVIAMYIGGMSGSTAGGMKVIRQYILFRIAQYKTESLFRPEEVRAFKIGDKDIDFNTITMVLCFFFIVIALSVLNTFVFVANGVDIITAFGLTASTINNVGLGFRAASSSFAFLSDFGLILSALMMMMGRLEFFTFLAILVPAFWRKE